MQILEALDMYVAQLQADGRSDHTVRQAQRHIRLLARFLGECHVDKIEPQHIAQFLISAMATKTATGSLKKPTSSNGLRSSLRTFFGFVHASGLVSSNPARLVRRARIGPTTPRGLTATERERLLAALDAARGEAGGRDKMLFTMMLATGVRLGSALALDVADVDFGDRSLRLRTMKGGGAHTVYLPDAIAHELEAFVADRRSGLVFGGVGARQVRRRLAEACRRAGIRVVGPHALRHSYALDLYQRTGDLPLVQAALGHRSLMSTTAYARASAGRVRAAVAGR